MSQPFEPPLSLSSWDPVGGRIGADPEHFVVEEVPAYQPSGEGEHLFLLVEKRLLNTSDVARALARAAHVPPRDVGFAGMKDRQAITRQWFSLPPGAKLPRDEDLPPGMRTLRTARHKNKLRTGHLIANRFSITLEDVMPHHLERYRPLARELRTRGVPNYFGPQRFGRGGQNLERAFSWLREMTERGLPAPAKKGRRRQQGPDPKFLSSVLQSEHFNRYAARRLQEPHTLISGEVVRLDGAGAHFVVADPEQEHSRLARGDIHLTGPLIGPKGLQAEKAAKELEEQIAVEMGLEPSLRRSLAKYAPGSRRDLVVVPQDLHAEPISSTSLLISFTLPAGAFATQVIREFTHGPWDAPREIPASRRA